MIVIVNQAFHAAVATQTNERPSSVYRFIATAETEAFQDGQSR